MTDHTPPTTQQLDDYEQRAAAATPGPWSTHENWPGRVFSDADGYGHVARCTGSRGEADAEFTAHARTAVPVLVAEVRRLRAELTTAQADTLGKVATELEGIDFHPSAKSNCRALCRMLAGRFRHKALEHLDAAAAAVVPAVAETGEATA